MEKRHLVALISLAALCAPVGILRAEDAPPAAPAAAPAGSAPAPATVPGAPAAPVLLSAEELENLIGPVALYPDVVLSSLLPATAFPIQVVMAARYVKGKGGKVTEVPEDKGWDASVLGLLQFPDVLAWLDENPEWMEQVAYVLSTQQKDLLDAVQSCRRRTKTNGALASGEQLKVTEVPAESDEDGAPTVIVIESADPEVVYVPSYDYAVISSPTWAAGSYPGLAFGVGFFLGAAGAWAGYELGWWGHHGSGDITVNNNWNTNWNGGNRPSRPGAGSGTNRPGWRPPGLAGGGVRPPPAGWGAGGAGGGWGSKPSRPIQKPSTRPAGPAGPGTRPSGGSGLRPPSRPPGSVGHASGGAGGPSAGTMPSRPAPGASGVMNGVGGKADGGRGRSSLGASAARPTGGTAARPLGGASTHPSAGSSTGPSAPGSRAGSSGGSTYRPSSGSSTRSASSRGSSSMGRSSGHGGGRAGGGRAGRR